MRLTASDTALPQVDVVAYKLDAMERTIEADKRTANEVQHSRRIVWKLPR